MKALLLIAHGSRRQKSNEEVIELAEKLKKNGGAQYQIFKAGFLELATPSISSSIEQCIEAGAKTITVLPYFLNSGTHVVNDIPTAISKAQQQHPAINIKLAQHIGASAMMIDLLIEGANAVN